MDAVVTSPITPQPPESGLVVPVELALPHSTKDIAELVDLYLQDNELYGKTFFPNMCRQNDAPFHKRIDDALWARRRKVAIKVFRDGAKTSRVRLFISKRIAYGYSRTILYISKSEGAAEATVQWIAKRVEQQTDWAQFYGLSKGSVWNAQDIEIRNNILGITIRLVAVGIHGQIRGLNFDDFRPDLIVCDDIEDEKTVNTPEQIKKHSDLLHGTVMRSLASPMDNPDAMIVIIQTPLDMQDAVETAFANQGPGMSQWLCVEASCFDEDEAGNLISAWPDKFSLEFLLGEKQAYIQGNNLSVWLREMEVTVTSPEECPLLESWLIKEKQLPSGGWNALALFIDPASGDTKKSDQQAITLTGNIGPHAYLIAYNLARAQDIDITVGKFFDTWDMMLKMSTVSTNLLFGVETVAYQKTLKKALEKEMLVRRRLTTIQGVDDKRSKYDVITQAFKPVASNGCYHCLESHTEFITTFAKFPKVKHEDVLDSAARGLDMLDLTGRASAITTGGIERDMASKALITRSAARLIRRNNNGFGRLFG